MKVGGREREREREVKRMFTSDEIMRERNSKTEEMRTNKGKRKVK